MGHRVRLQHGQHRDVARSARVPELWQHSDVAQRAVADLQLGVHPVRVAARRATSATTKRHQACAHGNHGGRPAAVRRGSAAHRQQAAWRLCVREHAAYTSGTELCFVYDTNKGAPVLQGYTRCWNCTVPHVCSQRRFAEPAAGISLSTAAQQWVFMSSRHALCLAVPCVCAPAVSSKCAGRDLRDVLLNNMPWPRHLSAFVRH